MGLAPAWRPPRELIYTPPSAFACVIFGGANPKKAYLAALMFGFFDALGYRLQEYNISANLTSMIPYVITVCMMVYVVVRSNRKKVKA